MTQTREFQAEVKQLLDIVINSLYTDKEIFLRELISNGADALEKFRYENITNKEVFDNKLPLEIKIESDDTAHILSITDTGIGMNREELTENLGTIAHSGSKAFIQHLTESDKPDVNLIGQFGVGFYSAFMVAQMVEVFTRSFRPEEKGYRWSCEGNGSYLIEEVENLNRGTKIVLHLKDDAHEYARSETIKRIIKQYSGFVSFPILLNGEKINTVQAIWTRNKNEVKPEEYNEFYKYVANAWDEPMYQLHLSIDAPITINAVLFVPKENFERLGFGRMEPGVNLYCRKVLIQQQADAIIPDWLRFLKGVVDSEELPLNISRETMQDSALVARLRKIITGRFLKFMEEQAKSDPDKYAQFWGQFGVFLKEGAASDFAHRHDITKLLRFESSQSEAGKLVSLDDYISRMTEDQKNIYFINGPSREVIEAGPYVEIFAARKLELLYTAEPVDDYILGQLGEYNEKKLISADQADLELQDMQSAPDDQEALSAEQVEELLKWMKEVLGDKVTEVKKSQRLTNSPAIVLNTGNTMTGSMERVMQLAHKDLSSISPKVMEINVNHPMIKRIYSLKNGQDNFASTATEQIFDTALISSGLAIDQRVMIKRMNDILERALEK